MSMLAVWLFAIVAVVLVGTAVGVFVAGRSTYRRSRVLARELTSLAADLERIMTEIGPAGPPKGGGPTA
jgi:uncharacterized membrane-anchored protein YhcB (DUF1043 family)